jgi:hypothetical protein
LILNYLFEKEQQKYSGIEVASIEGISNATGNRGRGGAADVYRE